MASFNQILLIGNLTRDPDMRFLTSGAQLASFGLAVSRRYTSSGEQKEEVLFIDITAFGRLAEIASEYLAKGSPVLVSGRLRYEHWTTDDGQKRSKHSVTADIIQFLGRRGDAGSTTESSEPDDVPF